MDKNGWSVGEAKQQFSEVLRRSEEEPQLIYRRNRLVAAVVRVDDAEQIPGEAAKASSVGEFVRANRDRIRGLGFVLPRTNRRPRRNDFLKALDELADRHKRSE